MVDPGREKDPDGQIAQDTEPPDDVHVPSREERDRVTIGPKYPPTQFQVYKDDEARGEGLTAFSYEDRRGWERITISLPVKARLYTRTSLTDPVKYSSLNVLPFEPMRRVEVEDDEIDMVDNALPIKDPSIKAERSLVEDEPVYVKAMWCQVESQTGNGPMLNTTLRILYVISVSKTKRLSEVSRVILSGLFIKLLI